MPSRGTSHVAVVELGFGRLRQPIPGRLLNAVVAEDLPGPGTVFLKVEWSFLTPARPGDEITGQVEVVEVREDKPITTLKTTVTRGDGEIVLDGTALTYSVALDDA